MAYVINRDDWGKTRQFVCKHCRAVVEYEPSDEKYAGRRDKGQPVYEVACPDCKQEFQTSP